VKVRVLEAGEHHPARELDDAGLRAGQAGELGGGSNGLDAPSGDGYGLSSRPCRIDGVDPASGEEQVDRHWRTLETQRREVYALAAWQRGEKMSRKTFIAGAALVALALPTAASAETSSFAEAKKGNLRVFSSVVLTRKAVDMMGGWLNESSPCATERRLRVRIEIFRTRRGTTTDHTDSVTQRMMNCAEGGPNLGFQLDASDTGFACPNGSWKPGRYDFVTRTRHLRSGLNAMSSLLLFDRTPC
jgi:hypothetical protein